MRPSTRRVTGLMIGLSLAASALGVLPAHATAPTASIVGHVTTTPIGSNVPVISTGLDVWLYTADGTFVSDTVTNPQGNYSFTGLGAGDYTIRFENQNEGIEEWWWNTPDMASSTALIVGKGQQVRGDAHVTAVAENLTTPTITGTPIVGSTLTSTNGTWYPSLTSGGINVSRQWLRNGIVIPGATGTSYTLTNADAGATIRVRVIAARDGMQEEGVSLATSTITGGTTTAVISVSVPTVSGTAAVGSTLTTTVGTWQPSSATTSVQWLRNGNPILGATSTTYVVTATDAGATIAARVTATATGHTGATASSANVTVPPAASPPSVVTAPKVSGKARVGGQLRVTPASWSTPVTSTGYAWLRDGRPISGATTATYVPVAADAGRSLSVRLTVSSAGGSAETTSAVAQVAKATSTGKLKLVGKAGKLKATFTLTSAGAKSGKVTFTVKVGKLTVTKTAKLKAGKVTVTLKAAKGKRKIVATYAGDSSTATAKANASVKVR